MNIAEDASPRTEAAQTTPVLELAGLTKQFGPVTAVKDIDLQVFDGESIALLGPSGSGKSTLLSLIAGFHVPTKGSIMLRGQDVSRMPPASRKMGVVFQDYALFPHLTVAGNVGYGLKMHRWPKADRPARVAEMLELVGLQDLGDRYPRQLSGGQKQRVALARALAFEPDLLLLDEPLAALDREIRLAMQGEIRRIRRILRTTLLHVTHDREEAMALGDRIVILRDGAIIAAGAPEELYSQPTSSFAAGFFAAFNVLPVESCRGLPADRARVRWLGREIELPCEAAIAAAAEVRLLVPRSGLRLGEPAEPGDVAIQGQVIDNVYLGDVAEVTLRIGDGAVVVARLTVNDGDAAQVGDAITLRISAEVLRLVALDRLVG